MILENPKRATISTNTNGNTTLVAAPTSPAYLVVDKLVLIPTAAGTATIVGGSTPLTGGMPLAANTMYNFSNDCQVQDGVFQCAAGTALVLTLDSTFNVNGFVIYRIRNF